MKIRSWLPFLAPLLLAGAVLGVRLALPSAAGLGVLDVEELARQLRDPARSPVVLDANTPKTRAKNGVIPGARLLSSYRDYDPTLELPADRSTPLVFYCYNAWCHSANEAAHRAAAAGYRDVSVLPEGIDGWIRAGRAVARAAGVAS